MLCRSQAGSISHSMMTELDISPSTRRVQRSIRLRDSKRRIFYSSPHAVECRRCGIGDWPFCSASPSSDVTLQHAWPPPPPPKTEPPFNIHLLGTPSALPPHFSFCSSSLFLFFGISFLKRLISETALPPRPNKDQSSADFREQNLGTSQNQDKTKYEEPGH